MGALVFIGDSITDAGRREDPEGLGHGWVRMAAAQLAQQGDDREVVNTGIGGDRVRDLRARWTADALDRDPEILTVYVGINDTWRRYDRDDPTTAEAFEEDYRFILRRAHDTVAPRLILVEPFVAPVTSAQRRWGEEDLDAKRAVVRRLADEFGAVLVPLADVMRDAAAQYGEKALAEDGVHPTELGATLIAGAWLAAEARVSDE
ncbi:SGNH/GDSL hydrolase family protein [Pseudolysinimonas sp.]|uniref:SGNH/GDSL hydrolase family protein n=1 Tax=Pseudolysinimonas sp. TaxID=2680009 RepID=UPI003F7F4493